MPTELERQVAEAVDENEALRWPALSRMATYPGSIEVRGWVPDVTLDKVLTVLLEGSEWKHYRISFVKRDYGYGCWESSDLVHKGSTPLDAACAALIASVQVEPATVP